MSWCFRGASTRSMRHGSFVWADCRFLSWGDISQAIRRFLFVACRMPTKRLKGSTTVNLDHVFTWKTPSRHFHGFGDSYRSAKWVATLIPQRQPDFDRHLLTV